MPADDSPRICRALIGAVFLELLLQGRIWPIAKEDESPAFREYRETALLPTAKRERMTACVLRDGVSPTGNPFMDRILSHLEHNPGPVGMLPASLYAGFYYTSQSHWNPPRWHRDQKPFVAADLMGLVRKRPWGGGGFSLTTTGAAARNAMQARLASCLVEDATLPDRKSTSCCSYALRAC